MRDFFCCRCTPLCWYLLLLSCRLASLVALADAVAPGCGVHRSRQRIIDLLKPFQNRTSKALRRTSVQLRKGAHHEYEDRLVIGMQVVGHDASVAAVQGGRVIGVIELERVHKVRYFDPYVAMYQHFHVDYTNKFVDAKIFKPALNQLCEMFYLEKGSVVPEPCTLVYDMAVVVGMGGILRKGRLQKAIPVKDNKSWVYVDHHHAHAALGWLDSPFYHEGRTGGEGMTFVLSYDGFGNDGTMRGFLGRAGHAQLTPVGRSKVGHSYGAIYDVAAAAVRDLGWGTPYGSLPPCPYLENPACELALAGSFMAYAATGNIREEWRAGARLFASRGLWDEKLWPSPASGFCAMPFADTNSRKVRHQVPRNYFACCGVGEAVSRQLDADFAATFQAEFEQAILRDVQARLSALKDVRITSLVLSGGCALNVKVNSVLARELGLPTHVPPGPGDGGLGLAGAWLISPPHPAGRLAPTVQFAGAPLMLGTKRLDGVENFAAQWGARRLSGVEALAKLLFDGAIVGVLRGRAEFGPRALGHRSLLSTAHLAQQKERLNRLKHRRWYRPCAPIVAAEDLGHVFLAGPDLALGSPYMSFAPPLQPWVAKWLPGIAHIDNTARPQGVRAADDAWMHSLLAAIRPMIADSMMARWIAFAGCNPTRIHDGEADQCGRPPPAVGLLINTSLNPKGKPIAEDVHDVLVLFCAPGGEELDYVLIEDEWLLSRSMIKSSGLCGSIVQAGDARGQVSVSTPGSVGADGLPVI